jgi:hypothetical protein
MYVTPPRYDASSFAALEQHSGWRDQSLLNIPRPGKFTLSQNVASVPFRPVGTSSIARWENDGGSLR